MSAWTPRFTPLSVVLIGVLLVVVAVLQYRWVGELSELGRQRMQDSLSAASERLQNDFEREFDRLWDTFRARRAGDFPDEIVAAFAEWRATFAFPELVEDAYWVQADDDRAQLYHIGPSGVARTAWPAALSELKSELQQDAQLGRRRASSYITPVGTRLLAFVVAQRRVSIPSRAIVLLRRQVILEQLIPSRVHELVAGRGGLDYDIVIVDETSDTGGGGGSLRPDILGSARPDLTVGLRIPDDVAFLRDGPEHAHLWSVLLQHRAGSLEAAVAQVRRRNLMIGAGVLVLLGASVLALVVATRRAQSLADQQVQFVAGVSHELRTPVSGISSLSQNLADGVVDDPAQVRTYGATIHRESARLAGMIERVLQFSAMRAGSLRYALRPMSVDEVIDDAVEAVGDGLTELYRFERVSEETLPLVLADAPGLSSAIQNLLSNAMKFSDMGGLIQLSAGVTRSGKRSEVHITVADRGRAIPTEERSRVFDPFFRGHHARTQQVSGSGLGLSLVKSVVEAHGGRVTYAAAATVGSRFTLHLPIAPAGDNGPSPTVHG